MKIREKLMLIQSELKAPKGQYNKFGKYYFRSCEDILEALKPILAKYKCTLLLSDEPFMIGDRIYIKTTAKLADCESEMLITVDAYAREEDDKKGMDAAQVTGSTSSYARKYALNGMFCIDDMKDPDTNEQKAEADKKQSSESAIGRTDINVLRQYLKEHKLSETKILKAYKVDRIDQLTARNMTCILKPENLPYFKQNCGET